MRTGFGERSCLRRDCADVALDHRAGMSHGDALAYGAASDQGIDWLVAVLRPHRHCELFLLAAADLANHHNAMCARVGQHERKDIRKACSLDRIAANADPEALPKLATDQAMAYLIREGAALGHDPKRAGSERHVRQEAELELPGNGEARRRWPDPAHARRSHDLKRRNS